MIWTKETYIFKRKFNWNNIFWIKFLNIGILRFLRFQLLSFFLSNFSGKTNCCFKHYFQCAYILFIHFWLETHLISIHGVFCLAQIVFSVLLFWPSSAHCFLAMFVTIEYFLIWNSSLKIWWTFICSKKLIASFSSSCFVMTAFHSIYIYIVSNIDQHTVTINLDGNLAFYKQL